MATSHTVHRFMFQGTGTMATEYNRAVLRVGIAQLAQQLGWNAIQGSPMELLTDVLERYILSLGRTTHRYSEQCE